MVKKACVFISGSGTNLRSIIKSSRDYNFPININLIISNKKDAKGICFAKKFSIPHIVLKLIKKNLNRLLKKNNRQKNKANLSCRFMRILSKASPEILRKIINIHPSLLPKYKGLNTFKRALGDKENLLDVLCIMLTRN